MSESATREPLDAAMARLADGDREAISVVYRALWPILVRYCGAFVGNDTDAEDLAQCALVKLFEQAHSYDPSKSARAWALAIAAWECRTYRRKRQRMQRNHERIAHMTPVVSSTDIEQETWRRDALRALEALVAETTPSDQRSLIDSFVNELSEPVHRKRKQRVLERLRRRWNEIHGND